MENIEFCPHCRSSKVVKNGKRYGRQAYLCRACNRQSLSEYACRSRQYSPDIKAICLKMHLQKDLTLRGIEQLTDVDHSTVYTWVKEANPNQPAIINDSTNAPKSEV